MCATGGMIAPDTYALYIDSFDTEDLNPTAMVFAGDWLVRTTSTHPLV